MSERVAIIVRSVHERRIDDVVVDVLEQIGRDPVDARVLDVVGARHLRLCGTIEGVCVQHDHAEGKDVWLV